MQLQSTDLAFLRYISIFDENIEFFKQKLISRKLETFRNQSMNNISINYAIPKHRLSVLKIYFHIRCKMLNF